jgi:hypothetical protein
MLTPTNQPFDFTTLTHVPHQHAEHEKLSSEQYLSLKALTKAARRELETVTVTDAASYIRKLVTAKWREMEWAYAKSVATGDRLLAFRTVIIASNLLASYECNPDELDLVSTYTSEEFLALVTEASEAWLAQHNLRLMYNSEFGFAEQEWEIFIDARPR